MPTGYRNSNGKCSGAGRQRKSTAELIRSGTLKHDLKKYAARLKEPNAGLRPIGPPPEYFDSEENAAWYEVLHTAHAGTVFEEDRLAVEQFAKALVLVRGGEADSTTFNRFLQFLKVFGLTPADRSRVAVQGAVEDNPFAGLTQ